MDFFKEHSIKSNESFLTRTKSFIVANIYKIANSIKSLLHPYRGPYGRLFLLLKGGSV